MSAFIVVDIDVTDPALYAEYRALVGANVAEYGGEFVVRGGAIETLEGDWHPSRLVIVRFDDVAAARRWYDSADYAPLKNMRQRASNGKMLLVEGL